MFRQCVSLQGQDVVLVIQCAGYPRLVIPLELRSGLSVYLGQGIDILEDISKFDLSIILILPVEGEEAEQEGNRRQQQ